jgi:hypothetical protein
LRNKQEEVSSVERDVKNENLNRLKDTHIEDIPSINDAYTKNKDKLIQELNNYNHN